MPDRLSIRAQLIVFVLAEVLAGAGLIAYALQEMLKEARRGAQHQLHGLVGLTAGRIEVVLQRRAELMARPAERPLVRAARQPALRPRAGRGGGRAGRIRHAGRAPQGRRTALRLATDSSLGRRGSHVASFRDGLASGRFDVSGAGERPPNGTWVVMLTQPVRDAAGEVGGLLILAADLQTLKRKVVPALPDEAIIVALDRELRYLMRTTESARCIGQPLPAAQRAQLPAHSGGLFELTGVDGVTRLNVASLAPASGWQVYNSMLVARANAGYCTRPSKVG